MIVIKDLKKTIFCVLEEGFDESQLKSLRQVAKMIEANGGKCFNNLEKVANYLNTGGY
jgi:hypothetical protein